MLTVAAEQKEDLRLEGHPLLIHALCAVFLLGRLLHAWGVSQVEENFTFRVSGMMMTFGTIIATALTLVVSYLA